MFIRSATRPHAPRFHRRTGSLPRGSTWIVRSRSARQPPSGVPNRSRNSTIPSVSDKHASAWPVSSRVSLSERARPQGGSVRPTGWISTTQREQRCLCTRWVPQRPLSFGTPIHRCETTWPRLIGHPSCGTAHRSTPSTTYRSLVMAPAGPRLAPNDWCRNRTVRTSSPCPVQAVGGLCHISNRVHQCFASTRALRAADYVPVTPRRAPRDLDQCPRTPL